MTALDNCPFRVKRRGADSMRHGNLQLLRLLDILMEHTGLSPSRIYTTVVVRLVTVVGFGEGRSEGSDKKKSVLINPI